MGAVPGRIWGNLIGDWQRLLTDIWLACARARARERPRLTTRTAQIKASSLLAVRVVVDN